METIFDPPEIEWIAARAAPKVTPTRKHGKLQFRIGALLERLGGAFGEVASEWRIHLPKEVQKTTLVPDVAYVLHARMAGFTAAQTAEPALAPDIAVEILS